MTAYIGGENTEGKKLKATSFGGTDDYGFSALPGGYGTSDGSFSSGGISGCWWSASKYYSGGAYFLSLQDGYDDSYWGNYTNSYLFSVRCLQD